MMVVVSYVMKKVIRKSIAHNEEEEEVVIEVEEGDHVLVGQEARQYAKVEAGQEVNLTLEIEAKGSK